MAGRILSLSWEHDEITVALPGEWHTVAHNHRLNCAPRTFNMVGQPIDNNPMRLDLDEAGRMLLPPVFIVNAVLNSDGKEVLVFPRGGTTYPVLAHS